MGTRRPRASAAPGRAANRPRPSARPKGKGPESPARALERLYSRRLRACESLGIPVPAEAREGPPGSLLRRIALLDRRIEVSLDLAGGRRFAPWDPEDEDAAEEGPTPEPFS